MCCGILPAVRNSFYQPCCSRNVGNSQTLSDTLMTASYLLYFSIFCYLGAAVLMFTAVRSANEKSALTVRASLIFAALALLVQFAYLYISGVQQHSLNFNVSNMSIVVSAILTLIFLLGCLGLEIKRLGIMVFPLSALSLVFALVWHSAAPIEQLPPLFPISYFGLHVVIAILAYSLLAIATIQSLLYVYQEDQLKNHSRHGILATLPPLQTMEVLLFRLIWIGFALLSFTLVSGALFSQQIFAQPFALNHHTVLAMIGWVVIAILLCRRLTSGLRGRQATMWLVIGFTLIQLGYFGTKIISEALTR